MKAFILSVSMILFILTDLCSQTPGGPITLEKKIYTQNGVALSSKQLKSVLSSNPASLPEFQKYKSNMNVATPLMIGGSACLLVGAAINLASSVKEANDINNGKLGNSYPSGLGLIIIGAVADLASLPLLLPARKHLTNSISEYNTSLKSTGKTPVQVEMVMHTTGLGVRVTF